MLLNTHSTANVQLVMNSFGTLFHDKIFFHDNFVTLNKILDMFQMPGHFQVFQTSCHPVTNTAWL